jgi:hypothetical protein
MTNPIDISTPAAAIRKTTSSPVNGRDPDVSVGLVAAAVVGLVGELGVVPGLVGELGVVPGLVGELGVVPGLVGELGGEPMDWHVCGLYC